tara:strand:- start:3 stop:440 length:438 start_codon:yes stop_codon:yes gene_type:complete
MFNNYTDTVDSSYLSESLHLEGEITTSGKLKIAGLVDGNVISDQLTVLDTGSINGNIKGNTIEIDGQVNGNIDGDSIVLGRNAIIRGDIYFAHSLKTEEGADVDGYIKKAKRKSQRDKFENEEPNSKKFTKPTLVKDKETEKEAV